MTKRPTIEGPTFGCRLCLGAALAAVVAVIALAVPVKSETAEDFFKGKQINLIVGYNPGGPYDVYARITAALLPKYIPGHPRIVAQNMAGVGSAKAANYLYQQASRDGLTLGVIGQQLPVSQVLGDASAKFDMRQFRWLGRFTSGTEASVIWHTSPTKSLADAMKRETLLAATSAGSSSDSFPLLMNRIAGTKFKMAKGYSGITGTVLAMERGETEGAHSTLEQLLFANRDWLRDGRAAVLVQYTTERHPAFRNVPAMVEFGASALDKQVMHLFASTADIGRAVMTPPSVPADRLAILRNAFDAMLKDPAFKAEIEKRNLEYGPMAGAELQRRVDAMLNVSPDVIKHAIAMSRE